MIRRVKDIESGNIEPRLKEVSQKALQGPNAIINTFMNILYEESQTLAADGSGYKRDTKVDYSINVSQSDAVSSFAVLFRLLFLPDCLHRKKITKQHLGN